MKALTWMIAGIGVGVAAYIFVNQPGPLSATGDADVEGVADRTAFWGSKHRFSWQQKAPRSRLSELSRIRPAR
jgi:hypothetical protein